jgi:hypothetical protein
MPTQPASIPVWGVFLHKQLPDNASRIDRGSATMNDQAPNEDNFSQEFEALGKNLIGAVRSAWEAPESKRLREDMTNGLGDLASTLKREADNLASHPTTQQLKNDVNQFGEKMKAPEAQAAVRRELMSALKVMNSELQKLIDRWTVDEAAEDAPAEGTTSGDQTESNGQPGTS